VNTPEGLHTEGTQGNSIYISTMYFDTTSVTTVGPSVKFILFTRSFLFLHHVSRGPRLDRPTKVFFDAPLALTHSLPHFPSA